VESATNPQVARYRRLGLIERVVAVSEDARSLAVSVSGFAMEATETIPNGIDVDTYAVADGPRIRESLGIAAGTPVVGIVARLAPEKDHNLLLEALALLRRSIDPVVLLVIGDGELRGELEARAAALGVEACVRFLGMRDDIPSLLAALDVFVLSSRTEGMSVTLLEAMASGRPVVATAVGGNAEVVRDGDTGRIVPAGDAGALAGALASILRDREAARRMGERGRARAMSEFSVKVMAKRYEGVYDRALAPRHRQRA
jgi:glycosyltransferase involved in cell wall biosynthesis